MLLGEEKPPRAVYSVNKRQAIPPGRDVFLGRNISLATRSQVDMEFESKKDCTKTTIPPLREQLRKV
jgi:hypothetical protein